MKKPEIMDCPGKTPGQSIKTAQIPDSPAGEKNRFAEKGNKRYIYKLNQ